MRAGGAPPPPFALDAKAGDITGIRTALADTQPKIVFVGLGFPKQERLIARLRGDLPGSWFVACGAAIPIAAGQVNRAHPLVQRMGLGWVYRLINEPRRPARRYLIHDIPFAIRLLVSSPLRG